MKRIARHSSKIAAAAMAGAALVPGCSGSPGVPLTNSHDGAFGTVPAVAAGAQHAGTVTWAEPPEAGPTWILPLVTAVAFGTNNVNDFEYEMWRLLYWFGNGVEPTESAAMSLASPPVRSNGDKTVAMGLTLRASRTSRCRWPSRNCWHPSGTLRCGKHSPAFPATASS